MPIRSVRMSVVAAEASAHGRRRAGRLPGVAPVQIKEQIQSWAGDPDADPAALPPCDGYDPADICAIKQTSGSTGVPKGIEATTASVNSSMAAVQQMFGHGDGDNLLVFLPVRYLQQRYWIYSALVNGHDVTRADRITVMDVARATSPTVIMGVPGFYEQLRTRVEASGAAADVVARREATQAQIGGRIRYLWTGSAPAGRATLDFFHECDVPLYEGYGLNETCIISKNHPGAVRVGSVGKVLPHKRIRFRQGSAGREPGSGRGNELGIAGRPGALHERGHVAAHTNRGP